MNDIVRRFLLGGLAGFGLFASGPASDAVSAERATMLVQVPYEAPPKSEPVPDTSVPPSSKPLGPEEIKRAEALLPLLDGKQEFWAMGEFVHLGPPVVPVLTKALTMPSPRIRYNAIETMMMIKDPAAVPGLVEAAKQANELPRIREHALRAAVRLDPSLAPPAIETMAKEHNPSIRKSAAFEARYIRQKSVVPILIDLLPDQERFVSITAINSLWLLTRHDSEMHDWDSSNKEERAEWAQEWIDWWNANKDTFDLPEPKRQKKLSP